MPGQLLSAVNTDTWEPLLNTQIHKHKYKYKYKQESIMPRQFLPAENIETWKPVLNKYKYTNTNEN